MSSKRQLALCLTYLSAFFLSAGCSLKDRVRTFFREEERAIAVRVGDKTYTKADLERYFDTQLSEFRDPSNTDKVKSNLLDSFVEERLLLNQADRLKVEPNPQALKAMIEKISATGVENQGDRIDPKRDAELERSVSENLKMQQYVHDFLLKQLSVSEDECERYYRAHLDGYVKNDVVHVHEILVDNLQLAERILALLKTKANKNFGDLARVYSKGASAADGGDLGLFQKAELPEEFEKAIFALSPGSVSKIVQTKYGYHIFLLDEKILAHQQKFIEVKNEIREKLLLERERNIINIELEALRRQIPVVIHRDRLGFNYIGTQYTIGEESIR